MIQFELNGRMVSASAAPGTSLLEYLRSEELYSVKHGCDHGECGACTILVNSKSMNACLLLLHSVDGKRIETLEHFSSHEKLNEMQASFLHNGAAQCGFCTPGMLLSVEALDREEGPVDEAAVKDALNGNLCRCTGYVKPVEAALNILTKDRGATK